MSEVGSRVKCEKCGGREVEVLKYGEDDYEIVCRNCGYVIEWGLDELDVEELLRGGEE